MLWHVSHSSVYDHAVRTSANAENEGAQRTSTSANNVHHDGQARAPATDRSPATDNLSAALDLLSQSRLA
jgi:hypothetical protein